MSVAIERTKQLLDKLKEGIQQVQSSEDFKRMLNAMSRFHNYSLRNVLLIQFQCPNATRVAGYHTWIKLGRQVKKGEKALWIFAPMVFKHKDNENDSEDEVVTMFKPVPVFDLSQTEGEPLPTIQQNQIANTHEQLLSELQGLCGKLKIEIKFEELRGMDGVSKIGSVIINSKKNPTEQAVILLHELAHEKIHDTREKRKELSQEQIELEAEATAFVVCEQLGLPETNSDRYLALYSKSYDLQESLAAIHQASQEILGALKLEGNSALAEEPRIAGQVA